MLSFNSVGQSSSDASQNIQTMRLRDDPPPITQQQRPTKKRKSPPDASTEHQQQQQPQNTQPPQQQPQQPPPSVPPAQQPQQPQQLQHVLPPPHALMHPMPGPIPPGYPYAPADYTPGGMPPPGLSIQQQQPQPQQSQSPPPSGNARQLSSSKRAEQNRKAQRAFRERRDQHVKALESRSQLLDAALASADEANRRWEECRALVDQLRVENAALRAALSQAHLLPPNLNSHNPNPSANGAQSEESKSSEAPPESKNDSPEQPEHNLP